MAPPLDLCLPLAQGAEVSQDILHLLDRVPCRLLVESDWEPRKTGDFMARLCEMRTRALRRVTADYWLSLSDDVAVGTIEVWTALQWLDRRPDWGGVGIWTQDAGPIRTGHHISMRCSLLRTAATLGYTFKSEAPWGCCCECSLFERALRAAGHTYEFHPTLIAEHRIGAE